MSKSRAQKAKNSLRSELAEHYDLTLEQLDTLLLEHNISLTYKNSKQLRPFTEIIQVISAKTTKKYRRTLRLSGVSADKPSQVTNPIRERVNDEFIYTILDKMTKEYLSLEIHMNELQPILEQLDRKLRDIKPILDNLNRYEEVSVDFTTYFDLVIQEFLHNKNISRLDLTQVEKEISCRRYSKVINSLIGKSMFKSLRNEVSRAVDYFEDSKIVNEYNRDLQKLSLIKKIKKVYKI